MRRVKIDRVTSPHVAHALEELGADLIGVPLVQDLRFADQRAIDVRAAAEITSALRRAAVVAHVSPDAEPDRLIADLKAAEIRHVEFAAHPRPPLVLRARLRAAAIGIGYCRLVASHDDDPSWILSGLDDLGTEQVERVELELLPEVDDPWSTLRDSTPAFEEELHLEDIESLAAGHPLFVSMGGSAIPAEIDDRLPSVAGLSFHIGAPDPANQTAHGIDLAALKDLLPRLRR